MSGYYSDSEMLDWLIDNYASFGTAGTIDLTDAGAIWHEKVFVRRPCQHLYEWHCFDGDDPRAAITAAMDAPPCAISEEFGCAQSHSIREHGAETPVQRLEAERDALRAALEVSA